MSHTTPKELLLANMSNLIAGHNEAKTALVEAALARGAKGKWHSVLLSAPIGVGRVALVSSLSWCLGVPFYRVDASRLCNTALHAVDNQVEQLTKLWHICGRDLNVLSKSIVFVEVVGNLRSPVNLSIQKELVRLIKGKTICLGEDDQSVDKIEFNTRGLMFVLSLSSDSLESEYLKNSGSEQELLESVGILPQLLKVAPTRLRLKVHTLDEEKELINSIKAKS